MNDTVFLCNCIANILMVFFTVCLFFYLHYKSQRTLLFGKLYSQEEHYDNDILFSLISKKDTLCGRLFSVMFFLAFMSIIFHGYASIYSGHFSQKLAYTFLISTFIAVNTFLGVFSLSDDWHESYINSSALLIGLMNASLCVSLLSLFFLLPLVCLWTLFVLGILAVRYVFFINYDKNL